MQTGQCIFKAAHLGYKKLGEGRTDCTIKLPQAQSLEFFHTPEQACEKADPNMAVLLAPHKSNEKTLDFLSNGCVWWQVCNSSRSP